MGLRVEACRPTFKVVDRRVFYSPVRTTIYPKYLIFLEEEVKKISDESVMSRINCWVQDDQSDEWIIGIGWFGPEEQVDESALA